MFTLSKTIQQRSAIKYNNHCRNVDNVAEAFQGPSSIKYNNIWLVQNVKDEKHSGGLFTSTDEQYVSQNKEFVLSRMIPKQWK